MNAGLGSDEQARVGPDPVELDGPVEVGAGAPAGAALVGDRLAGGDVLPDVDRDPGLDVDVPGHQVRGMGDDHDVRRVVRAPPGIDDLARPRGVDRRPGGRGDVDAAVEVGAAAVRRLEVEAGTAEG